MTEAVATIDLEAIRARAATLAHHRSECRDRTYSTAWFGAMTLGGPEIERDVEALVEEVLRQRELIERLRPMGDVDRS